MKEKSNLALVIVLLLVLAVTRWPGMMPENFSAVYAFFFCAGIFLPRGLAWGLPLGTILLTDILLNTFHYHVSVLNPYLLFNYAAYAALIGLGRGFSPRASWWKLVGGGLIGAVVFYLVTNTAAWLHNPEYPKTLGGLIQALTVGTAGWPETWRFFRNTLLSSGLFTALFVGAVRFSEAAKPKEETAKEPATEGDEVEEKT